jgi:hypothetical protein
LLYQLSYRGIEDSILATNARCRKADRVSARS